MMGILQDALEDVFQTEHLPQDLRNAMFQLARRQCDYSEDFTAMSDAYEDIADLVFLARGHMIDHVLGM